MSLIRPLTLSRICARNNGILYIAVRNHWNKDYKPGNYPRTPEQRELAAKKYELQPDDYKPYPDNGNGLGDYPDLPLESGDSRDPFYPWDNPATKRNFNETLHADADMYSEERYDINARPRIPLGIQFLQFVAWMSTGYLLFYITDQMKMFLAIAEKQYPRDGVHYTFDPAEPKDKCK